MVKKKSSNIREVGMDIENQKKEIKEQLREKKRLKITTTLTYLEKRFPKTFDHQNPTPLKIGINKDIKQLNQELEDKNLMQKKIFYTLRYYTRLPQYIENCKEGAQRVDLDGILGEKISKEEAQYMREERSKKPLIGIDSRKIHHCFKQGADALKIEKEKVQISER